MNLEVLKLQKQETYKVINFMKFALCISPFTIIWKFTECFGKLFECFVAELYRGRKKKFPAKLFSEFTVWWLKSEMKVNFFQNK